MSGPELAQVRRGELIESVHHGHVVLLAEDGSVAFEAGDPQLVMYGRSALKPLQAVAMVRAGLELPLHLLALACASHNGEPQHLDGVQAILDSAGLDLDALGNTPDLPFGEAARTAWLRAGKGPESLTQNCSGKHAAMVATCVRAGWPTRGYLDARHPLQRAIREVIAELSGDEAVATTVDGCGAPLFSCTVVGLARAFGTIASTASQDPSSPIGRVGAAMNAHPAMVAGQGREVTIAMTAVPGLVAKDGAEGVCAMGLPDGRAAAFKVSDGSSRPQPVLVAALLAELGIRHPALTSLARVDVLGHGRPVGRVELALARLTDVAALADEADAAEPIDPTQPGRPAADEGAFG